MNQKSPEGSSPLVCSDWYSVLMGIFCGFSLDTAGAGSLPGIQAKKVAVKSKIKNFMAVFGGKNNR